MEDYDKAETIFTQGVALNNRLLVETFPKIRYLLPNGPDIGKRLLEYINVYLEKYSDDSAAVREKTFIQTRIR